MTSSGRQPARGGGLGGSGGLGGKCRSAAFGRIWPPSTPPRMPCERHHSPSGTSVAISSPSKSRPKWLRFSEGAVGPFCILEHGRGARLLTAGKTPRGEGLLGAAFALLAAGVVHINDLFAQSLMHRDVVEVTEDVLQLLQSCHETFRRRVAFLPGNAPPKNSVCRL